MAEQPARQVPSGKEEDAVEIDARALAELHELRELLFHAERSELIALRERLHNPRLRAKDVSEILAEAIRLRRGKGGRQALSEALAPSVEEALRESVRKDPRILADALFPSMGPAIRRAIGEYIRSMTQSFDLAMEHSFSLQGLKWRFESIRTGRKFADVVMLHSLLFRVEQLFLIHKKTGLMLVHVVAPFVPVQDPDMVSAMLTAIQDFVRDSFKAPAGETLESMQVGELQVCVEQGPYASLAAVIRGQAPPEVRLRMQEKLEEAHQLFGQQLEDFQGDAAPFQELVPSFSECFAAHYKESGGKPKPFFQIATAVLLLAGLLWATLAWRENRRWNRFATELRAQPGILITSFAKSGGRFHIRGLRDPLALDPEVLLLKDNLDTNLADFEWRQYQALDPVLVLKRANAILEPPAAATLALQNGVLYARGEAPRRWQETFRERAPFVAGVKAADISGLTNTDHSEFSVLKKSLETTIILFPVGVAEVPADRKVELDKLAKDIREVIARAGALGDSVSIEVVGHADDTGTDAHNIQLSDRRARAMRAELVRRGIARNLIRTRGAGYNEPLRNEDSEDQRKFNRSITLRVISAKAQ